MTYNVFCGTLNIAQLNSTRNLTVSNLLQIIGQLFGLSKGYRRALKFDATAAGSYSLLTFKRRSI